MQGRKVLVIEKSGTIGGSVNRFFRDGVPFDTGFHFTGGFAEGGLLCSMLEALGIRHLIAPLFMSENRALRILVEASGCSFDLPGGIDTLRKQLAHYFPEEVPAIDAYFRRLNSVSQSVEELLHPAERAFSPLRDEDLCSLQELLDPLTQNEALKAILGYFCLCHGAKPSEVSFSAHSLVSLSLFESPARVENGGDAFVRAFRSRLKELGVEVLCGTHIVECRDLREGGVGSFLLSNGDEVAFASAVLTVHPSEILRMIPAALLRPRWIKRVNGYQDSVGFFSVFATLDLPQEEVDLTYTTLFPSLDMNRMLTPEPGKESALIIVPSCEKVRDKTVHTLTAFEPTSWEEVQPWADTQTGQRPGEYQSYKRQRSARIVKRIESAFPAYRGHINVLDSASRLTYRDWLNNPTGAAYGIKQKPGQLNLAGKLPVANLFAAGQSALLPGVVGAMLSSFIVCRDHMEVPTHPIGELICS